MSKPQELEFADLPHYKDKPQQDFVNQMEKINEEPNEIHNPSSHHNDSNEDEEDEEPNEIHNPSSHHNDANEDEEDEERQRIYQEAAIYLQEGENNDKFNTHPHSPEDLPAYRLAHSHWFYCLDFMAAIAVLLLTVFERPAFYDLELPVRVQGSIEVACLLALSIDIGICLRWMGWDVFIMRKRTLLKGLIIAVMLAEAILVVSRQTNHCRLTRALRPIFLFHTHYCKGVRRLFRQIIQSLPPILDMVLLMLFLMFIFSILGFHLFSGIPNDKSFQTIERSFISLFILLTTANYPDIMMPAYAKSRLFSVFFVTYLLLELFFLMNLLVAVVYDTFSTREKAKFRALYYHKHEACIHSFQLLISETENTRVPVKDFVGMMKYFAPHRSLQEYYFMFKSLNTSKSGMLSLEEFYYVYSAAKLHWTLKTESGLWSSGFPNPFNKICKVLHRIATCKYFEYGIYALIAGNFIWILCETIRMSTDEGSSMKHEFTVFWIGYVCTILYSIEALIKILGRGPRSYFSKGWDMFDFVVTGLGIIGLIGEEFNYSFHGLMLLRPFRLLRLFRIKERYRDVLGTLFVLFNRFISLAVCIIIVYYFFAIIAMEIFLDIDLSNCCQNTSVAANFAYNSTAEPGYYYLNNFQNIFVSWVTLFELTVVNNWFIIMEGYAHAVSEWTRIYFMSFYIVMMMVMNIIVAFVLESFIFRINYRRQMHIDDIEDHNVHKEEISLFRNELEMVTLRQDLNELTVPKAKIGETPHVFYGERPQSRDDFSLRMYSDEVEGWASEFRTNKQDILDSMDRVRSKRRLRRSISSRLAESFRFGHHIHRPTSYRDPENSVYNL